MVNVDLIILMVVLLVFILFFGFIMYLLFSSGFSRNFTTNSTITNPTSQREPGILRCPRGQCATSLVTGTKRCPEDDQMEMEYQPGLEVCNSRFLCDNRITPFASQADGSSQINGVCEEGVECACYSRLYCADYISSIFTASNGNATDPLPSQRISFPQQNAYNAQGAKLAFQNPALNFCTVPISWLPLATPGCGFVPGGYTNNMNYEQLVTCMGQEQNCDGSLNSPCLTGTLAIVTSDPESLTRENITNAQAACVFGNSCPCGQLTVYDTNFGATFCRNL